MDPDDARETAIRRFGDITRVNTTCRAIGKQRDKTMRHGGISRSSCRTSRSRAGALRQSWVHGRRGADSRSALARRRRYSAPSSRSSFGHFRFPTPIVLCQSTKARTGAGCLFRRQLHGRDRAGQRIQRRDRAAIFQLQPLGRPRHRARHRWARDRRLLQRLQLAAGARARVHEGRRSAGPRASRRSEPSALDPTLRRRPIHRRPSNHAQRTSP